MDKKYYLETIIPYTCLLGLFLPLILLYNNNGYRSANLYLAGFLFFSSFYVLENFYFFYGNSLPKIAFFTTTHSFFYLIGPFAYLYLRSFLKGNNKLSKIDYLHFVLFIVSFIGYIPYLFSSWEYKLEVAQNLYSENWDISSFRLNKFFYHEIDQVINVLHTYFYAVSLWYLIRKYKKTNFQTNIQVRENKKMKAWVTIFASVLTVITINFTVAMASVWIYDDKSIFLSRAGNALLFASFVYIGMNMIILFFPHILYGIQINSEIVSQNQFEQEIEKIELQLFTNEYKEIIEAALENIKEQKLFLTIDYKLLQVSNESGIPTHHLTYFFNELKKISFSDWRNNLRIEHALALIHQGEMNNFTLQAISVKCGFSTQSTFIRAFKNLTGITPSNYLKANI